jgi:transposase InsO family protein
MKPGGELLDDTPGTGPPGVIFHSERGIEYVAYAFRDRLAALGFVQSMNRPREITDNAQESFFHSMKSDAVHGFTCAAVRARAAPETLHPVLQRRAPALADRLRFPHRL